MLTVFQHYTTNTSPIHHPYTTNTPSIYQQYTINTQSVYQQYTINTQSVCHHYTNNISSVHHQYDDSMPRVSQGSRLRPVWSCSPYGWKRLKKWGTIPEHIRMSEALLLPLLPTCLSFPTPWTEQCCFPLTIHEPSEVPPLFPCQHC